jgi:hypothetical protein
MSKRDIKMDDALAEQCYVNPSDFDRKKYAALIRADEREECAKLCDKLNFVDNGTPTGKRASNKHCAAVIRARSKA